MNCKPGDLAVVIKVKYPEDRRYVGAVLKVLSPGGPDPEQMFHYWAVEHSKILEIPDEFLKPIRGSEGTDETLAWKKVPTKTLESPEGVQ